MCEYKRSDYVIQLTSLAHNQLNMRVTLGLICDFSYPFYEDMFQKHASFMTVRIPTYNYLGIIFCSVNICAYND